MTPRPPIADLLDAVKRLPVSLRIENGLREGVLSINDARAIETLRRYLPDYLNAHDALVAALERLTKSAYLIRRRDTDCYCDESPHTDRCGSLIHDREQARALLRTLDAAEEGR